MRVRLSFTSDNTNYIDISNNLLASAHSITTEVTYMASCKSVRIWLFVVLSILITTFLLALPFDILLLPNVVTLTDQEFQHLVKSGNFCFDPEYTVCYTDSEEQEVTEYAVKYKLFDIFTIKKLKVNVVNNRVFVGGKSLGFSVNTNGVIVVGSNYIITNYGKVNPIAFSDIKVGDIIVELSGRKILSISDIMDILSDYTIDEPLEVKYIRDGREGITYITPAFDAQTLSYKLGLWLKEDAMGVGTLTYVDSDSKFGALGHAISLDSSGTPLDISGGKIYDSKVIGVKIGSQGHAGQLLGYFNPTDTQVGEINANTCNGVFGEVDNLLEYASDMQEIVIGGRATVRPGNAKILSCIDGKTVKAYDIEIIKTNYQSRSNDKSMVIRVTDEDLLNRTGGIVQGMSGSPIIQDGKLVGAVTHVFVNDASKGFGLYIDWML